MGLCALPPLPSPALFLPGSCQDLKFSFLYSPVMAVFELEVGKKPTFSGLNRCFNEGNVLPLKLVPQVCVLAAGALPLV